MDEDNFKKRLNGDPDFSTRPLCKVTDKLLYPSKRFTKHNRILAAGMTPKFYIGGKNVVLLWWDYWNACSGFYYPHIQPFAMLNKELPDPDMSEIVARDYVRKATPGSRYARTS